MEKNPDTIGNRTRDLPVCSVVKYVHKAFVILGRINLVELVKLLGVDLNQIAARAAEIERTDQNCSLVLGQLIDKTYVTRIAEEINEKLLQQGQITIGELTRHYDLPSDFLQTVSTICILYLYVSLYIMYVCPFTCLCIHPLSIQ